MEDWIKSILRASIQVKRDILEDRELLHTIGDVVERCVAVYRSGGKLLFCGNGGSAADAQHLAAEFSGRFYLDRAPLFAEALHVNTSYLTAVANDYGYEAVFSRMVGAMGRAGDLLFGLSTSGNSANVVAAFERARTLGMITVGLTGQGGGRIKDLSDFWIGVPATDTPRIQEAHITIGHIICELVEHQLFSKKEEI